MCFFFLFIQVTFSPELPEEARGDQFETATPVHLNEVLQDENEEQMVTSFDYSAIELHTEETPREGTSDTDAPSTETYPDTYSEIEIPNILNELEEVKTQEPGDQSVEETTVTTPFKLLVSSTAATTPSHQDPFSSSQVSPVTFKVEVHEDMEGSGGHGIDDETEAMVEGSGDETAQTTSPARDHSIVVTDETEIGGTEPTTLVINTTPLEATTKSQIEDLEGSASGERDEASGDDTYPAEVPVFGSTSTPHSQQPQRPATEVTAAPVLSPDGDAFTESGSGADQLSEQDEASGKEESRDDLTQEVIGTVLPDVTTLKVEEQNTLEADIRGMPSESSTAVYSTRPSFTATEKMHTSLSSEHTPTTPEDHTSPSSEVYTSQAELSAVTPKPHGDQLSIEGEASGLQESVVDLTQEVIVTVPPEVVVVTEGGHTTLKANTVGASSESSMAAHFTRPSFVATEENNTSFITEWAPTASEDPISPSSEVYMAQTESDAAPHDRHTTFSTTIPLHTFNYSTHLVSQRVPKPNEATTPLPDDYVDYDKELNSPLLESVPQIKEDTTATEEPGRDSNYSVEGSTVNIRGT